MTVYNPGGSITGVLEGAKMTVDPASMGRVELWVLTES